MRMVLTPQQLAQASYLTYDGYDPTWIIGTHTEGLYDYGDRGFFHHVDPHRKFVSTPVPTVVQHIAPGVTVQSVQVQPSKPVVQVAPKPKVPVVELFPHAIGHTLGDKHGYKNIVVMRVPVCCDGCEAKWKDKLMFLPGFIGVNVDRRHSKDMRVTVFGHMDTHSVVKTIQKVKPGAEFWRP